jgi:hypothetical protein
MNDRRKRDPQVIFNRFQTFVYAVGILVILFIAYCSVPA